MNLLLLFVVIPISLQQHSTNTTIQYHPDIPYFKGLADLVRYSQSTLLSKKTDIDLISMV